MRNPPIYPPLYGPRNSDSLSILRTLLLCHGKRESIRNGESARFFLNVQAPDVSEFVPIMPSSPDVM